MGKGRRRFVYLDTYALVEIILGNPRYDKYLEYEGVTCILNLYELFYRLLREHGTEVARLHYKKFESITIPVREEHIQKASEIKLEKKLSYIDALGYAIAKSENIKFLTGDDDFKGMEGVEFVK